MADTQTSLAKVIEVCFAVAAADGIDFEEVRIFLDKLMASAALTEAVESHLQDSGLMEGEEDVNFMELLTIVPAVLPGALESAELIELSDSYLEAAAATIGDSYMINVLCLAWCIVICAGDDEISGLESEAINKVANALLAIDEDAVNTAKMLADAMLEAPGTLDED